MFEDADDEDFEAIVASQEESQSSVSASSSLSLVQKDKIERNRRKALALKLAREKIKDERTKENDSGAGFFIPPEEDSDAKVHDSIEVEGRPAPFIGDGMPECIDCEENFSESYLFTTFGHYVCDGCKENDHNRLITKTEAKKIFLLKDCDLDRREPPLKFIIKKNPHNPRWGEMKLYLRYQVESRAIDVWGSEEALEEEIAKMEGRKNIMKKRKFDKKIKELRMKVRGSLFTRKIDEGIHTHTFGEEVYDEDKDEYSETCTDCGYVNTYEKM
ncbi:DNA repair protein complementing XP-A cells homolog [Lepeophtheirus salmonis]|uniref:DNA repair protein complementing XP-A cells homolog n=1 Tax=Lepeophtheirus salmonis TaxID=72036 RepID=UPI001AE30807|nr:DNA repair protein complementing XP-A cells homolog [Lepeophtheirus salmonis]